MNNKTKEEIYEEIKRLKEAGLSNEEIGREVGLIESTVRFIIRHI